MFTYQGMRRRGKHEDEVVNSGNSLCAREGRLSGSLGLRGRETRVCRCCARPMAGFPAPEISEAAGSLGLFVSGLRLYRCARAGIFPEEICLCPPLPNRGVRGGESIRKSERGSCPAGWRALRDSRGLRGETKGSFTACQVAVLLPATSLKER